MSTVHVLGTVLAIAAVLYAIRYYFLAREGFETVLHNFKGDPFSACPGNTVLISQMKKFGNTPVEYNTACYPDGLTNSDKIFNTESVSISILAPIQSNVTLYSDVNRTGKVVASLLAGVPGMNLLNKPIGPEYGIPVNMNFGMFKNIKFKSVMVVLNPKAAPTAAHPTAHPTANPTAHPTANPTAHPTAPTSAHPMAPTEAHSTAPTEAHLTSGMPVQLTSPALDTSTASIGLGTQWMSSSVYGVQCSSSGMPSILLNTEVPSGHFSGSGGSGGSGALGGSGGSGGSRGSGGSEGSEGSDSAYLAYSGSNSPGSSAGAGIGKGIIGNDRSSPPKTGVLSSVASPVDGLKPTLSQCQQYYTFN